ncbi:MAG TPA: uroporphyrinogen-III synthase [Rubrivivax sp.]
MTLPRVIVTRPRAQATPWVEQLRAAGLDAVALPLIDIAAVADTAPLQTAWHGLAHSALVMFVSANAVQHFFAARPQDAPWPAGTLAGSTGPGTSAALRDAGLASACVAEPAPGMPFETESLWDVLRQRDWRGRRVLIVRGEGGRDWLSEQLAAAGASVTFLAAYRRVAPRLDAAARLMLADALARPLEHVWHFSSSEAVGHLADLAPGADWSAAHALASHPRIVQAAQRAGFGHVALVGAQVPAVVVAVSRDPGR